MRQRVVSNQPRPAVFHGADLPVFRHAGPPVLVTLGLLLPLQAVAVTVVLTNLSNPPNLNLQVGDQFQISISGASPNQSVTACVTYNGTSEGCTGYGSTDASGNFTLTGTENSTSYEGSWVETWSVGGVAANPTLSFFVGSSAIPQIYAPDPGPNCTGSG